jgi:hypothetical protein
MGCFVNKVASSSFVKTFLALEGMRVDKISSPHAYKSRLVPEVSRGRVAAQTPFPRAYF